MLGVKLYTSTKLEQQVSYLAHTTFDIQSLYKILQENDRLKDQLLDKNKQIETQNDKISELLQQNQK